MDIRRAAVRVICVNEGQEVLLIQWRDPTDSRTVWEPPGGGIEPGERPIDAARRELREETGLPGGGIADRHVMVGRDVWWNGDHWQGDEAFFLARFPGSPRVSSGGLLPYETAWLQGYKWVPWQQLADLPGEVEPPGILQVLTELEPGGPWAAGPGGEGGRG